MKAALFILIGLSLAGSAALAQDQDQTQTPPPKKKHHHKTDAQQDTTDSSKTAERSGAVAGEPDTDGCGLGWQVTDKRTIIGATTRATTNATVPPTFGMTSGTIGCAKHPFTMREVPQYMYVASNYDALRLEMAEGRGEFLDAFARTMGCHDTAAFDRAMQSDYGRIDNGKTTPVRMFENVKEEIRRNPALSSDCNA